MTIVDELSHLDLSAITSGRASITASISGADLQALLAKGIGPGALGDLGTALTTIEGLATEGPTALLHPLVAVLEDLLGPVSDGLQIGPYQDAVLEAAQLISGLLAGLDAGADPATLGAGRGTSLGAALGGLTGSLGSFAAVGLDEVASFGRLVQELEAGVPLEPQSFAEVTIRALLPFPTATLTQLRTQLDTVTTGALAITLPKDRTAGLITAFEAVATAATGTDTVALTRALGDVDRARAHTVAVLNADLAAVSLRLDAMHLDRVFDDLAAIGATLTGGEEGILEFLAELRTEVVRAHHLIPLADVQQIQAMIAAGIEMAETRAEEFIGPSVDAAVERTRAWLQGLLDHLGLTALRAEVTDFIHAIAAAVTEAGLDEPVRLATEPLDRLNELVSGPALADAVQAALHEVADLVGAALDGVISALAQITDGIEGLADQALPILERATAALSEFRTAIDAVVHDIDGLGIEQATTQVIEGISSLRKTAQDVLTVAPLPDALRPAVEQLIHTIEAIDLASAIDDPVKQVLDQLRIPDSFTGSLDGVVEAVSHLVPTEAIAAIQTEIGDLLEKLTALSPGQLLSGITDLLRSAAGALDGLDPRPAAETLSGPFRAVLAAVDAVDPTILLKPVIDAFDQLLDAVHIPTPATGASRVTAVLAGAGETAGQALTTPLSHLLPAGSASATPAPGSASTAASGTPTSQTLPATGLSGAVSTDLPEVHPGDIVRLFGYVPNLLRQALSGLEAGPAGEALEAVDRLVTSLAADLRTVATTIWAIGDRIRLSTDEMLAALAGPQVRAQSALIAHAQLHSGTSGGPGVDVDLSIAALAFAGPAALHAELAPALTRALTDVRDGAAIAGGHGVGALNAAATALERTQLHSVLADVDGFLAALDPEPLAADLDALAAAALAQAPDLVGALKADLDLAASKLQQLITGFNPGALLQRFLPVLTVLAEQLDLIDPRRLALELSEVHRAIRAVIIAYDPMAVATDIAETTVDAAAALRAVDPAALLGDTSFLQPVIDRIQQASPVTALTGAAHQLDDVGTQLADIDLTGLVTAVNGLGPKTEQSVDAAVKALKREVLGLLEALKYATGSASVSVSVSTSPGGGG